MKRILFFTGCFVLTQNISAQNVGIGTLTPTEKLEVFGNIRLSEGANRTVSVTNRTANVAGNSLLISAGSAGSGFQANPGGNIVLQAGNQYNISVSNFTGGNAIVRSGANSSQCSNCVDGGFISFETGAANNLFLERMRITASGKVGIGNTNPTTASLVISGTPGSDGLDLSTSNLQANLRIIRNSNSSIDNDLYLGDQSGATSSLHLFSNNIETMIIKGEKVGIGTILPSSTLDVRAASPVITIGNTANKAGALYLGNGGHGLQRGIGNENDVRLFTSAGNLILSSAGPSGNDFVITSSGAIGIGTGNPQALLHVAGAYPSSIGAYAFYAYSFAQSSPFTGTTTAGERLISIRADSRIVASEFNAISDARVKNIIGRSNSANDLATLQQLKITDYTFIDVVEKGNAPMKKVIAQEVETVYPIAVKKTKDVIPNIYKMATIKNGVITVKNNLVAGDNVQLIFEGKKVMTKVIEATPNSFTVNETEEGSVFVYGKEVDDFRVVDYEALTTLTISATQELLKQLELLKEENIQLKRETSNKLKKLEDKINSFIHK